MNTTRLELAIKVLQWQPTLDTNMVAKQFNLTAYEFNTLSEQQFFDELFFYCHNRDTLTVS